MSENRAVWKSNNQGFIEHTFMQMVRRNGDMEMRAEVERLGEAQKHKWAVPNPCVVGKNQEGYRRNKGS